MLSVFDAIHGWTMLSFFQPTTRNASTFLMGESSSSFFQHSRHPQVHSWNDYCATNHQFKGYVSTIHHPPIASRIFCGRPCIPVGSAERTALIRVPQGRHGVVNETAPSHLTVCWGEKMEEKEMDAFPSEVGLQQVLVEFVGVFLLIVGLAIDVLSFNSFVGFTPFFCYLEFRDFFFFFWFLSDQVGFSIKRWALLKFCNARCVFRGFFPSATSKIIKGTGIDKQTLAHQLIFWISYKLTARILTMKGRNGRTWVFTTWDI